ncbi:hypothetical protein QE364_001696 [Nocardioides zeae]|uniref:DUF2785 domain-containing protein n=2 Tax=Nocardioides zeae TaxID=1457234 RepID=A0AAJ1WZ51_9ACTN|nr:DUF2785 domain-containing protein [Nocardioides zeae]MDQ1103283.1 hypothetical protein [Nocardioides zeae]MDR6172995.1 hypothetical protein [Nocardioides zeae]MDR6209989.1 hypothetical protein [Nocardioides zeae]
MVGSYWRQVIDSGLGVPTDRPLGDLTAELTRMLGSSDPAERDHTAYPMLATWIDRGVYDELLAGLGDGIATGLLVGLGEVGTDSVFRRSFSALLLGECVARDNRRALVRSTQVLDWGDRLVSWYLRERDDRGFVEGKGWAHAVAHGADAIGTLAESPHLAAPELTVLLDVLADRVLAEGTRLLVSGEPDRIAEATMRVLRRNVLPLTVVEPWVRRIAARATAYPSERQDPYLVTGNPEAFLRALHLQLALAPQPPQVRSDLLLVLVDALRQTNPGLRTRA